MVLGIAGTEIGLDTAGEVWLAGTTGELLGLAGTVAVETLVMYDTVEYVLVKTVPLLESTVEAGQVVVKTVVNSVTVLAGWVRVSVIVVS